MRVKGENRDAVKPFLRWAGGKTWLLPTLRQLLGDLTFDAYHEPFLGGGAVFFGLLRARAPAAYLSDLNGDLIDTYIAMRDQVEDVIEQMRPLQTAWKPITSLGRRCRANLQNVPLASSI